MCRLLTSPCLFLSVDFVHFQLFGPIQQIFIKFPLGASHLARPKGFALCQGFKKLQMTVICSFLRQLSQRRSRFIAMEFIAMGESPGREGEQRKQKRLGGKSQDRLWKYLNTEFKIWFQEDQYGNTVKYLMPSERGKGGR